MDADNRRNPWQRFGGHLILAGVALLLILGRQMRWADDLYESGLGADAAVSPIPIATTQTQPSSTSPPAGTTEATAVATVDLPIVSDNSLAPAPNPHTYQVKLPAHDWQTYTVARGDTPNVIADKFNISPETLLGGNPWLSQESNQLQVGVELVILPVDGLLHTVGPGETLADLAERYDVPVEDIIAYELNNLEFPYRLQPDTQLLIPGAEIEPFYWTAPKSVAGSGGGSGGAGWAVVGRGFFDWPVTGRCITTFYWYGHPAIDIALSEGSPVVASDRGTVTYASWAAGQYYDYGNLIVINHGNGYETLYAHLSSIGVYPGQTVEPGQWIGATGNTGRSSGPHIHFEIRLNDFRFNPLDYLSGPVQNCT